MKPITNFERITEYPILIEGTEIDSVQHFTEGHKVDGCDPQLLYQLGHNVDGCEITSIFLRGRYSHIHIEILWELDIIRVRHSNYVSYCDYRLLNDYRIRTPKGFSEYLSQLVRDFLGLKK